MRGLRTALATVGLTLFGDTMCRARQNAAAHLGLTDTAGQQALERLVWAYAHGVAHLRVGGQFGSEPGDAPGVLDISTFIFSGPPRLLALED